MPEGMVAMLVKRKDSKILPELIAACCILQMLHEIHREQFNEDWFQDLDTRNINKGCTVHSDSNTSDESGGKL